MEAAETITRGDYTAEILYEEDSSYCNPRDNDNAAVLVCSHRNYNLGDREPTDTELEAARRGFNVLVRYLELTEGALAVQPLYLYDHSVLHMSTRSFVGRAQHAEWDSGMVGFAYVPRDNVCGTDAEHAPACIDEEVEEYDAWGSGDVYWIRVVNAAGEEEESCGGYIGFKWAVEAANEMLECFPLVDEDAHAGETEPVVEALAS